MVLLDLSKMKKKADEPTAAGANNTAPAAKDSVPDELPSLPKKQDVPKPADKPAPAVAPAVTIQPVAEHAPDELPPLREEPKPVVSPSEAPVQRISDSGFVSSQPISGQGSFGNSVVKPPIVEPPTISYNEKVSEEIKEPMQQIQAAQTNFTLPPIKLENPGMQLFTSELLAKAQSQDDIKKIDADLSFDKILDNMESNFRQIREESDKKDAKSRILARLVPLQRLEQEWRQLKLQIEEKQRLADLKEREIKLLISQVKEQIKRQQETEKSIGKKTEHKAQQKTLPDIDEKTSSRQKSQKNRK